MCYCINLSNQQPILGLTIRSDLSWSEHINTITSKARHLVGLLFRQFYSCTDTYTLYKLYLTIVRPHLEYTCEVWDPHLDKDINLIEKVQNFVSQN